MDGLSKRLDGKFKAVRFQPGEWILKDGRKIDLRTCTVEEAEHAIATGFEWLKKIEEKPEKKTGVPTMKNPPKPPEKK